MNTSPRFSLRDARVPFLILAAGWGLVSAVDAADLSILRTLEPTDEPGAYSLPVTFTLVVP